MPLPAMLAAAAPYAIPAVSGLVGGYLSNMGGGQSQSPQKGMNQGSFWGGAPAQTQQFSRFKPGQEQLMQGVGQMGQQGLQNTSLDFGPIAQAARARFSSQTLPALAERFAGAGAVGGSGWRNALSSAQAGLETNLAGMEQEFNQGNINQYLQMLQLGLTPSFENIYMSGQPGAGQALAGGLGQSIGPIMKILMDLYSQGKLPGQTAPTT